jgi:hypothetical protein
LKREIDLLLFAKSTHMPPLFSARPVGSPPLMAEARECAGLYHAGVVKARATAVPLERCNRCCELQEGRREQLRSICRSQFHALELNNLGLHYLKNFSSPQCLS